MGKCGSKTDMRN